MEKFLSLMETMLVSPIFWGVVAFVAIAFTLGGRFNATAASTCLWIAWGAAVFGLYRAEVVIKLDPVLRYLILVSGASLLAIGAVLLGRWFVQPKQEQTQVPQIQTAPVTAVPTPEALRTQAVRDQLQKLTRIEIQAVRIIQIHGHIRHEQVWSELADNGFSVPIDDVVSSVKRKTSLLQGSFSGEVSLNPELKDAIGNIIPEFLTPIQKEKEPRRAKLEESKKAQVTLQPPHPITAFDSSLAEWRLKNKPEQLELHDLFLTDFKSVQQKAFGAVFVDDSKQISVQYGIFVELALRVKFVVFYIGRQDQHTQEICNYLADHYQFILENAPQLLLEQKTSGDSGTISTKEAVFSNRIYIYHETYLPAGATVQITKVYEQRGLSVILRGTDYLSNKKMEAEVLRLRTK